jgi:hypothetical protein
MGDGFMRDYFACFESFPTTALLLMWAIKNLHKWQFSFVFHLFIPKTTNKWYFPISMLRGSTGQKKYNIGGGRDIING